MNEKHISILDKLEIKYGELVSNISNYLKKYNLFKEYSKKYDQYVSKTQVIGKESMDFISNKILLAGFIFLILIITNILKYENLAISLIQIIVCVIGAFFLPDLFLHIEYKNITRRLENDLLKAVTIMNNAFKSGRSIMQAVELVYLELDGEISDEFKKMFIDLNYGLELEIVFNRFAKRLPLEEIKYMASSLVILNKTGGNIVKVFNSIEKGFFDRKKMQEELKSTIALSEVVFRILISIPILIFAMLYIINKDYYLPLITTSIGRIILVVILFIYILYIIIIRKLVRLEE